MYRLGVIALFVFQVTCLPLEDLITPGRDEACGYNSCPSVDSGVLNVHLVPHTHDDVGWLKTVDQYYYGSRNNIQKAGVQYIIDSVVRQLIEDPKRRFVYVETAFFWKWWTRQTESMKRSVHELVRQGRLEFIGGAWSMNDEAAAHYQSTIDQFTFGLRKLNDTFGECGRPKIGWQIDPFGHSREFASMLAGMTYDGLFFGRIDWQDKGNRLRNKAMEMIWRGDDDLGETSDIFTGVLYNHYSPPSGFCFDVLCSDEPIIDDPDSPMYNVEERVSDFIDRMLGWSQTYHHNNLLITMGDDFHYQDARMWFMNIDKLIESVYLHEQVSEFLQYCMEQQKHFRTNNIILTMGGDFTFQDAAMWYTNLDILIEYANLKAAKEGLKIKLFYSTPSCYLKAIKDEELPELSYWSQGTQRKTISLPLLADGVCEAIPNEWPVLLSPTLPTKQDDFFPYATDQTAYWTGYYTSRPTTKYFERLTNGYLQGVKQMQVLANLEDHNEFVLHELSAAMGVMQHHDAITGTEKQHVTHDYERILTGALDDALTVARQTFNKISQGDALKPPVLDYNRCQLNQSQCATSEESDSFVLTIYNPLAWEVTAPITVPIIDEHYAAYGPDGKEIVVQISQISNVTIDILTRNSRATHEITFIAEDLPSVGYREYYIRREQKTKRDTKLVDDNDFYANVNDYWKHVKEQAYYDIRNLENYVIKKQSGDSNIPDAPVKRAERVFVNSENKDQLRARLSVMDNKDGGNKQNIEDLERLIREFKNSFGFDDKSVKSEAVDVKMKIPALNDDEIRMLSDDPFIVEAYRNDRSVNEIGNEHYTLSLDDNGEIAQVTLKDGQKMDINIKLEWYRGCVGDNRMPETRSSGAYIFRPNGTIHDNVPKLSDARVIRGPVFDYWELDYIYGSTAVVIYKNPKIDYIQVVWTAEIDVSDEIGKEVVIKYKTEVNNNGVFYTDASGRQMLKRKLNERPQWNVTLQEPVPGNYYPVVNKIHIDDDKYRLSVITDRSQGGSSLANGEVELMVHRRLLRDDAFGVDEALNESAYGKGLVAKGSHYLYLLPISKENSINEKTRTLEHHLQPQVYVSNARNLNFDDWLKLNNEWSGLKNSLPQGVHLLTLEPWKDGTLLLRLENYLERNDKNEIITVDISELTSSLEFVEIRETNLAGNQWLEDAVKWDWKKEEEFSDSFNEQYGKSTLTARASDVLKSSRDVTDFRVELAPKEIKTFVIKYRYNGL